MRVQHDARNTLGTRLRCGAGVGLIAAAIAVPVAGIVPVTAAAQPAPPAAPAAPETPSTTPEKTPAAPGAPGQPGGGAPGLPGAPLAESATSITIMVNGLDGEPIPISIDATATVEDLKILIEEQTGVAAGEQQLITESEVELEDSRTLASYELTDGAVVNLALA